ncbi:hypothetical protein ACM1RC_32640, partial [Paenibacillus azoreducens]|uniref:hypothetical protein n=1 Tax=Paenibacillus azoreducens TaxID=116718 RepID=UPI0039F518C2
HKQTIHGQMDVLSQQFCISRYKMPEKDALSQHFSFSHDQLSENACALNPFHNGFVITPTRCI